MSAMGDHLVSSAGNFIRFQFELLDCKFSAQFSGLKQPLVVGGFVKSHWERWLALLGMCLCGGGGGDLMRSRHCGSRSISLGV